MSIASAYKRNLLAYIAVVLLLSVVINNLDTTITLGYRTQQEKITVKLSVWDSIWLKIQCKLISFTQGAYMGPYPPLGMFAYYYTVDFSEDVRYSFDDKNGVIGIKNDKMTDGMEDQYCADRFSKLFEYLREVADKQGVLADILFFNDTKSDEDPEWKQTYEHALNISVYSICEDFRFSEVSDFSECGLGSQSISELLLSKGIVLSLNEETVISGIRIKCINPYNKYYLIRKTNSQNIYPFEYKNGTYSE